MAFFESSDVTAMVVALLSLGGVIATAWIGLVTKRETALINKSVNHIQPGEKRLYELAVEASLQLGLLGTRMSCMESKLDQHIAEDRRCPLLEDCAAFADQKV